MTARRAPSLLAVLLGGCAVLLLGGCAVTEPSVAFWPCTSDADCVDGHLCATRAGDTQRSCVPACERDADCPARSICLPTRTCARTCTFASDGTPRDPCPEGLACGRLRYPLGTDPEASGLCIAAATCTTNADCGQDARCTSSDTTQLRGLSNLPCGPVAVASGCPAGWVATSLGCLADCDESLGSVACAPAMSCHRNALVPVGARASESACYFGFYGAPCQHDTECLVGRCADVGGGRRQCTETCDAAAFISLEPRETACATLLSRAGPLGLRLVLECSSPGPEGVCVARGGVGSGCRSDGPGPDDECAEGLECRDGLCTRGCFDSLDCALAGGTQNPLASGYCDLARGECARVLDIDSECSSDDECASGICATPTSPFGEYRCDAPRRPSEPCTRDEECLSRRCVGMRLGIRVCG